MILCLIVERLSFGQTTPAMRELFLSAMFIIFSSLSAVGCASHASSSSEAIQHAKTLRTSQQQADYLVTQAKAFLGVKDYTEAVKTMQYVLASIDINSQPAKEVLDQARQQLARDTQEVVSEATP